MPKNRGKQFEDVIEQAFRNVENTMVLRLHDQTTGFKGSKNPCDFIMYHKPFMYTIECKTVHGNTLPFTNITDYQWEQLLKMSEVPNIVSGIICWWIDKDVTLFMPIQLLKYLYDKGDKSVRYDCDWQIGEPAEKPFTFKNIHKCIMIHGKKKRVFFDYDIKNFFCQMEEVYGNGKSI